MTSVTFDRAQFMSILLVHLSYLLVSLLLFSIRNLLGFLDGLLVVKYPNFVDILESEKKRGYCHDSNYVVDPCILSELERGGSKYLLNDVKMKS